jgi:hypothetical protein
VLPAASEFCGIAAWPSRRRPTITQDFACEKRTGERSADPPVGLAARRRPGARSGSDGCLQRTGIRRLVSRPGASSSRSRATRPAPAVSAGVLTNTSKSSASPVLSSSFAHAPSSVPPPPGVLELSLAGAGGVRSSSCSMPGTKG